MLASSSYDLAAQQLLSQNDRALLVEADEVERVLADIDADSCYGFNAIRLARHEILLVFAAPCQLRGWVGQEHGGSIPLATVGDQNVIRPYGRVEDGRGSLGPLANAPFPIPAHQTGRADFRHPAFRLASP